MKQLEVRAYERQEIADILHVRNDTHNFKRDVENRLMNWGYQYEIPHGGAVIITHKPETAEERLKEIMFRLFGLDTQTGKNGEMKNGTTVFACYLQFMMTEDIAETMPWDERYSWLEDNYGLTVKSPCLQRWTSRLVQNEIMSKSTGYADSMWWRTYKIDGISHREPVDDDDPELLRYQERRKEIFTPSYKMVHGNEEAAWAVTRAQLKREFGCTFYRCKCIQINGITNEEIETVLKLVEEIVDAHAEMLMREQTNNE